MKSLGSLMFMQIPGVAIEIGNLMKFFKNKRYEATRRKLLV
jgi:hypothetical protein